jgi:hypothetical protein
VRICGQFLLFWVVERISSTRVVGE